MQNWGRKEAQRVAIASHFHAARKLQTLAAVLIRGKPQNSLNMSRAELACPLFYRFH